MQFLFNSLRINGLYMFRALLAHPQEVKGKAIPLQALTGPEGSRRLRLPDFKTIGT
jgi:hypothetical protein